MVWLMCAHTGNAGLRRSLGSGEGRGRTSIPEGKRATGQENYYLEAYDCDEPEDTTAYPIPQQCLEIKEPVSPVTFSGTK